MSYIKKVWVDVSDPENLPPIPEGQDALCCLDADNLNRIENGIEESISANKDLAKHVDSMIESYHIAPSPNPKSYTNPGKEILIAQLPNSNLDNYAFFVNGNENNQIAWIDEWIYYHETEKICVTRNGEVYFLETGKDPIFTHGGFRITLFPVKTTTIPRID